MSQLPPAEALPIRSLVTPSAHSVATRVLAKTGGGNFTVMAFDTGQELREHTAPFDAFVVVLEGTLNVSVGGNPLRAEAGDLVRLPANVPHALNAPAPARMLLVLLREVKG
jgi:quercetin dioxygenase-like cupin family protein